MNNWRNYIGPLLMILGGIVGIVSQSPGGWSLPIPIIDNTVDPATTAGSWVVVVEETSERTPAVAKVLTNEKWWSGLDARGLKKRLIDKDSPDAAAYKLMIDKHGMPVYMVLHPTGKVMAEGKLPATLDELESAVKKATGR